MGEIAMKTGKRILVSFVVVLVVLIAVVAVLINVFGDRALKVGIERGAEHALKVGVRLNDATLSIFGGKLNLNGLQVDNPQGYQNPQLMTLGNAFVAADPRSLLSDTVQIERIQLDNVSLTIEQKGLSNNLQEILNNLPKSDAPAAPSDKPGKKTPYQRIADQWRGGQRQTAAGTGTGRYGQVACRAHYADRYRVG